jgi:CCR4-NOT complex subunit CAF16
VTVDLDVLVRSDLIDFLVSESQTRGATIVCKSASIASVITIIPCELFGTSALASLEYETSLTDPDATHIFDGLHPFPTQVCHMQLGKTTSPPLPWPPAQDAPSGQAKDLFHLALGWLKEDKVLRKEHEKVTGRIRGPKPEVSRVLRCSHHSVAYQHCADYVKTTDAKTFFEKYDYSH